MSAIIVSKDIIKNNQRNYTMAKAHNQLATFTPGEAKLAVLAATKAKRSVFIHGSPGIGKSDIVRDLAGNLSVHDKDGNVVDECIVYDVRLLLLDPTDLRGLPYIDDVTKTVKWSQPSILPPTANFNKDPGWDNSKVEQVIRTANKAPCILFLDELTSAPPSVQAAAYQLVLDRKIGDYSLPENCRVIAAGNLQSDNGVTYKMPTPLANRFMHIEMRPDPDEWLEWAMNSGIHAEVFGFISGNKGKLHQFSPGTDQGRAFATPRSWEFVSDLLHASRADGIAEKILSGLVIGTVGQGIGTEFMAYRSQAKDLPKASDIINGKAKKMKNGNVSAEYYISAACLFELEDIKEKMEDSQDPKRNATMSTYIDNVVTFMMDNCRSELQTMAVRAILKRKLTKGCGTSDIMKSFFNKYASVIVAAVDPSA